MEFEIGKTATLFVLCFEGTFDEAGFKPKWMTFQNPVNLLPDHPFSKPDWLPSGEFGKKVTLPVDGPPIFTVSLVAPYSGDIVDAKTVRLEIHGRTDWRVTEVELDMKPEY